ncbi:uncharacterized protein LOC141690709 [Apium graveolens]|uniref:uncharacterized protein LOC141690709 n=1 Tax=Apium graveolens TaxID=4045 RepID=UPI003D7A45D7
MGPPWKIQFLQDVIRQHRPDLMFVCEMLSNSKKMKRVRSRTGFQGMLTVEAQGRSGGITLLWKDQIHVSLLSMPNNHIDVVISIPDMQIKRLTGFYGEPNRSQRRRTWELLRNLSRENNLPWCIIGDMKNILQQEDKKGGMLYPQWLLDDFNDTIEEAGLNDLELHGHQFTWERGRGTYNWVEIRLDRALALKSV